MVVVVDENGELYGFWMVVVYECVESGVDCMIGVEYVVVEDEGDVFDCFW